MSPVSQPKESTSELFHDQPVRSAKEDLFGWGDLADRLGDALTLPSEDPIVIGLYGAWGSGKSSLMNMVAESLEARQPKRNLAPKVAEREAVNSEIQRILPSTTLAILPTVSPTCVIVRFNPWYFKGEEALILAFFQEMMLSVKRTLVAEARELVQALGGYVRILLAFVPAAVVSGVLDPSSVGGVLATATSEAMAKGESSLSEKRDLLMTALRSSKVRIIVFIDDIDRLYPDDVLTMMKLVRLVGDLPYVSYLLGFDQEVVAGCLAKAGPQTNGYESGKEYLAKIVQLSVQVPAPRVDKLREYANVELAAVLRDYYPSEEVERLTLRLHNNWSMIFGHRLHDLRQVKRIVNAIRVALPLLKGKVDPVDGVIFESLRVYSPEAHRLLSAHPEYLFKPEHVAILRGGVTKSTPDSPLSGFLKANPNVLYVLRDLLLMVAANSSLPIHHRRGRVLNMDDVSRALNLGVNPARVRDWREGRLCTSIQEPSNDTYNMLMEYYENSGGWDGALTRVRNEVAGLTPEVAKEVLRSCLIKASDIVQEIEPLSHIAKQRLADACALLMCQASLDRNQRESDIIGALPGFLMNSTNLTVSWMVFGHLQELSQRSFQESAKDAQNSNVESPIRAVFGVYRDTVRHALQNSIYLTMWLNEPPCNELRDALGLMGWNTPAMDETQRSMVRMRIEQFDSGNKDAGYRRIVYIYFADAPYWRVTDMCSRYTQLAEFIDPNLIAEALGPNPLPAPLTPDELAALANLPDEERALKLFFHAHSS